MSAALVVSAIAAAAAAALLATSTAPRHRGRVVIGSPRWRQGLPLVVAVGVPAAAVVSGLAGRHLALLVVVAASALGVLRLVDRAHRERQAQERRQRVVDYCEALAGELRAGQPVARAVERSVEVWPEAESVAAAARLGASVPVALRRLSTRPGAATVGRLAGAWEISASTGAGLAIAVEQVLGTLRAEEATARSVRAELASARATARLVCALPVVVLVAAQGIGARPWHFLIDTAPGVACLGAGAALSLGGLAWIDRIAAASVAGSS